MNKTFTPKKKAKKINQIVYQISATVPTPLGVRKHVFTILFLEETKKNQFKKKKKVKGKKENQRLMTKLTLSVIISQTKNGTLGFIQKHS